MAFYPTLSAEVCLVDDQPVLDGLLNSDTISIKDVFFPQSEHGGYYRPFIGMSYYLDKVVWDLDVRSMHLDNIIMHLINVLLLFCIMRLVINSKEEIHAYFPFLAAALFAMHPIATESVNWISGRTDLMAGNFILASSALLLLYRSTGLWRYLLAAIIAIVLGIFSKEASLGMIIATCFILSAKDSRYAIESNIPLKNDVRLSPFKISGLPFLLFVFAIIVIEMLYIGNYWFALIGCLFYFVALLADRRNGKTLILHNPKTLMLFLGCSSVMLAVYFVSRRIAFKSDVGKIGQTLKLMFLDINYSISVFLGASGFYFKKVIFPFPLNFFILQIDPLYDLAGIFLLLFCLRLLTRLNLSSAFFIAGVCMFLPALPFAFGTIAWTGYAERYIYISSAFWIVSAVMYVAAYLPRQNLTTTKVTVFFFTTLTLLLGWQTYTRNIIWQKNVRLFEDTIAQSPKARVLREMYMYALFLAGNINEAKHQYVVANSLHSLNYDGVADLVMAGILTNEGKLSEALDLYEKIVLKSNNSSEAALKQVIQHLEIMKKRENVMDKNLVTTKLIKYKELLHNKSKDPMVFYTLGQKALAANDRNKALDLFVQANNAFSPSSPYKRYSAKLIKHLKSE